METEERECREATGVLRAALVALGIESSLPRFRHDVDSGGGVLPPDLVAQWEAEVNRLLLGIAADEGLSLAQLQEIEWRRVLITNREFRKWLREVIAPAEGRGQRLMPALASMLAFDCLRISAARQAGAAAAVCRECGREARRLYQRNTCRACLCRSFAMEEKGARAMIDRHRTRAAG